MHEETTSPPFEIDLRTLAVGAERVPWLGAMIDSARADLRPRDFSERHLVDELAINRWRLLRVYGMEKSVYERQFATFNPQQENPAQPNEDLYHLAQAYVDDADSIILAALARLEARFHRQFSNALRMLMMLRRLNPLMPQKEAPPASPATPQSDSRNAETPETAPCR